MSESDAKVILILRCRDCGKELNRTDPITKEQAAKARVASAFAAGPCPNHCRSSFADLNINTRIDEVVWVDSCASAANPPGGAE